MRTGHTLHMRNPAFLIVSLFCYSALSVIPFWIPVTTGESISVRDPAWESNCVYGYMSSITCSNTRAVVAQLVRASDQHSEGPGLNPEWIGMSTQYHAGMHPVYTDCSKCIYVIALLPSSNHVSTISPQGLFTLHAVAADQDGKELACLIVQIHINFWHWSAILFECSTPFLNTITGIDVVFT